MENNREQGTGRRRRKAGQREIDALLTDIMRGTLPDREPSIAERLRAAEALARRLDNGDAEQTALKKLDAILEAIRAAE